MKGLLKTMSVADVRARLYPEVAAGGFSHVDGKVGFYQRVNALLLPHMTVVDFGAGRGQSSEDPVIYRRELSLLRGKVKNVVGLDVDDVVLSNPQVDEAHVVHQGSPLPLADQSVDLVVSDYAFEHITDPEWVSGELHRVLTPGGWICARTPNKWGSIGIPARLVPNRFHNAVLRLVQPEKQQRDTFPTAYRLNSFSALARYFPPTQFLHANYAMESEPAYFGSSETLWRIVIASYRLTPRRLGSTLYVFLRKL